MPARAVFRDVLSRAAPGLMADRNRRYERDLRIRTGRTALAERVAQSTGAVVSGGPFAGLSYAGVTLADVDSAAGKLTGVYESSLAPYFTEAAARFDTFIDVGCADGYYAVGFAVANPTSSVYAYDLSRSARRVCSALAVGNGVAGRVKMAGRFDVAAARALPTNGGLLLMDVEGAEDALLDTEMLVALRECSIVVEVHEHVRGIAARLPDRLTSTHAVVRIDEAEPTTPQELEGWDPGDATAALDEMRGSATHWLVCEPLQRLSAAMLRR